MKNKILILFISAFLFISGMPATAENQPEEIRSLIRIAEVKLEKFKKDKAEVYAKDEIKNIEKYIKDAKKSLKEGKEELALLTISIGMAYFKKIEAKKELLEAENELNRVRAEISSKKETSQ